MLIQPNSYLESKVSFLQFIILFSLITVWLLAIIASIIVLAFLIIGIARKYELTRIIFRLILVVLAFYLVYFINNEIFFN